MNKKDKITLWATIGLTAVAVAGTSYWFWAKNFLSGDPEKNNRRIRIRLI